VRRRLLVSVVVPAVVAVAATVASPIAPAFAGGSVRYRANIFSAVEKRSDITYGTAIDEIDHSVVTLTLDRYTPKGDTLQRRPAIVWVHGGAFRGGDKTSPELVDEANQFARKGYVNVSINYRLADPGCIPGGGESCIIGIREAMEDAQTAVRFLRSRAKAWRIDPTRIAIGGSSAGAITALNVGYNAANPGPGDHQQFSSAVEAVQSISGCAIGTTPGPDGAHALLFHGTADPLVPYGCALATVAAAKAAKAGAILRTWIGQGHVPYVQNRDQILHQTRNFFYNHLDLAHAPT
jgi:acetyl esterase/lipase